MTMDDPKQRMLLDPWEHLSKEHHEDLVSMKEISVMVALVEAALEEEALEAIKEQEDLLKWGYTWI